jgi:hypothetical protein
LISALVTAAGSTTIFKMSCGKSTVGALLLKKLAAACLHVVAEIKGSGNSRSSMTERLELGKI